MFVMQLNCVTNGCADLSRRYGEIYDSQNPNFVGGASSPRLDLPFNLGIRAIAPRDSDSAHRAE